MNTPIALLVDVLKEVQDKAERYQIELAKSEAATRAALIDPILRALGWDVADPSRVSVELTDTNASNSKQNRVDYALRASNQVVRLVEAKSLGSNLNHGFQQIVNYSFSLQVGEIFITDGLQWNHYRNVTHNNQNPVRDLKIGIDRVQDIAVYLIQHLDAALIAPETPQIDELAAKIEILETKVADLEKARPLPATPPIAPGPSQPVTIPPPTTSSSNWENLQQNQDYQGKKPSQLRLPDGREVAVGGWSSVLIECCRYALEQNPALRRQMPITDSAGKTVALISTTKSPKNRGGSFITVDNLSYWVDTNYQANGAVANVLYILGQIPTNPQAIPVAVVL